MKELKKEKITCECVCVHTCVFACMYVASPLSAHKSVVSVRVYTRMSRG